ncbi:hypothetical protein [Vulcanisaeta distributa]|nr:hypothetical protein [Vulcanisaeta distributa]
MHYYDREPVFKEMRVRRIHTVIRGISVDLRAGSWGGLLERGRGRRD